MIVDLREGFQEQTELLKKVIGPFFLMALAILDLKEALFHSMECRCLLITILASLSCHRCLCTLACTQHSLLWHHLLTQAFLHMELQWEVLLIQHTDMVRHTCMEDLDLSLMVD